MCIRDRCAAWKKHALEKDELSVRVGRWNIPGEPIVILVDFQPFFEKKNDIYTEMWNRYQVDSLHAYGCLLYTSFIVALASKWSVDEPIVISTADAESLKKYFAAHAKALLDKGVTIQQVNGIKTLFTVSPADGSYKVNFGAEEFMNYFKAFLRPQLVDMLF